MPDSMHLLEVLQNRGYQPHDNAAPGEGWFDRRYPSSTLRVVLGLTSNETTIVLFAAHMAQEWRARFDGGTPSPVILAALRAAEIDAGDADYCPTCRAPDHDQCGDSPGCRCCIGARRQD